ncbi:hypothetical protein [Changpingibacter yushuensis]|uniref:hypothetical protein n=1 Tax=Changpingibacter yushuensis TaxID=2758440 RepID=UPI00165E9A30|nr:hypothetical protein [Changpingibacter yushuensis]
MTHQSHAAKARDLLQQAHDLVSKNPLTACFVLGAAGVHALLETAEQQRHTAQALILLIQPAGTSDHTSHLAALAAQVDHPDGPDPAGNLTQLLEQQWEERAARHEAEAE